ncbi:septum formation protein Maf [Candidatus Woesearchaeota archaeon]|nr:septum formation protein Maf [Candidatus Woesearchaeota archaeon]
MAMEIILASKSPRRREILEKKGYDVKVDISDIDEESVKKDDVKELVMHLARLKAEKVAERNKDSIVVAADTLVFFEGQEIGQPKDEAEAERILRMLAGKMHEVYSGLCVINTKTGEILQDLEVSRVTLKNVSDDVIRAYVRNGHHKGKAGAYNINDPEFESFIDNYEGSFTNIMGLPQGKIQKMIELVGG